MFSAKQWKRAKKGKCLFLLHMRSVSISRRFRRVKSKQEYLNGYVIVVHYFLV